MNTRRWLPASFADYCKTLPQFLVPQHLLSHLMRALTTCRWHLWKDWQIQWFIRSYRVDMSLAKNPDPRSYADFSSFFTRELAANVRPIAAGVDEIACPVDGSVSQSGRIDTDRVFQAKGHHFTLEALLGGLDTRARMFRDGLFATLYLSPKDYHRIHMPLRGRLREMIYVPGRLFGVNASTARVVPGLFARNERVICLFDTEAGPMAMIMVGAMLVGSMETVWAGTVTPPYGGGLMLWEYADETVILERGEEMGRFNTGSTVIVLFATEKASWGIGLQADATLRMGQVIGRVSLTKSHPPSRTEEEDGSKWKL